MAQYLTVKQAVEATGKSDSTIKRLLTSIKNDPDSADRQHILPSVDQYAELKKSGAPFQWEISEDLLKRRYPDAFGAAEPDKAAGGASKELPSSVDSRYVQHLEQQVSRLEKSNDALRTENSSLTTSIVTLTDRVTGMLADFQSTALDSAKKSSQQGSPISVIPTTPVEEKQENDFVDVDKEKETDTPKTSASKSKTSRKRSPPKKVSWFETHTPTFHKAFSGDTTRKS